LDRAVNDRLNEARVLNSIGLVYLKLKEMQRALDYYEQAPRLAAPSVIGPGRR